MKGLRVLVDEKVSVNIRVQSQSHMAQSKAGVMSPFCAFEDICTNSCFCVGDIPSGFI